MGFWTRTYKKSVAFYKKAEAKVMKNYFVYLYKDEQKKTSSWMILFNEYAFVIGIMEVKNVRPFEMT